MFDPKPDLPNLHTHTFFNPTSHLHERWPDTNVESRVRKPSPENYQSYWSRRNGASGLHLRPEDHTEDDDESPSPPLWRTNYKYLSPNSRSQAIARGQWELMEMVKTMPETSYELSLKDLVEHPVRAQPEEDEKVSGRRTCNKGVIKREEGRNKMGRSRSGDSSDGGGLLLKMAFPFRLGSKRKKKNLGGTSSSFSRVSPRPEGVERGVRGGGEKEWWKKRFSGEGGGGGSGSSGGGGSSSGGSGRKKSGCWSFLTKRNMKTPK